MKPKFNPHQHARRLEKSQALAYVLYGAGLTSEIARLLTDAEWDQVAKLAECNPPHSDECREMVARALRAREIVDAKMAGRDPFRRMAQ